MLLEDGKLLITKGADEIYFVDEINSEDSSLLFNAYSSNDLDRVYIKKNELITVLKKLEKAGVIYKGAPMDLSERNIAVGINWYGNGNEKIKNLVDQFIKSSKNISISENAESANLLLLVRDSDKLVDILDGYEKIKVPHIFIDIAYDHTVSVGPLVFPGETACLSCFIGRITRNWGDVIPPKISNVSDSCELIASLIFECIKTFQKHGNCPEFIGSVWSFNVKDFSSRHDKVFRLPWCPICFPKKPQEGVGSFELPWKISTNQIIN